MYIKAGVYNANWLETRTAAEKQLQPSYEWATCLEIEVEQQDGTKVPEKIPYPHSYVLSPRTRRHAWTLSLNVSDLRTQGPFLTPIFLKIYPTPWAKALTIKDIETKTHEDRVKFLHCTREVCGATGSPIRSGLSRCLRVRIQCLSSPQPARNG